MVRVKSLLRAFFSHLTLKFRGLSLQGLSLPGTGVPALCLLSVGFMATSLAGPGEGQTLYESYCSVCHGIQGEGETMGKPLNDSSSRKLSDLQLIATITDGRSGTGMNSFRSAFNDREIHDIAGYIRVLQGGTGLTEASVEKVSGSAAVLAGEVLFKAQANCFSCHSYDNKGGNIGPALDGVANRLSEDALLEALIDPSRSIASGYEVKEVETNEGEVLRGRFRNDSDLAVQIQSEDGSRWVTYFKDRVKSITDSDSSLMPDIFSTLGVRDQENLLEFLKSL